MSSYFEEYKYTNMNELDVQKLKVYVKKLKSSLREIAQKESQRTRSFSDALFSIDKIEEILGEDPKDLKDHNRTKKAYKYENNRHKTRQFQQESFGSSSDEDFEKTNGILMKYCETANKLCKKVDSLIKINHTKNSQAKEYRQYLKQEGSSKKEGRQPKQQRIRQPKPKALAEPTPKKRNDYSQELEKHDEDILKLFQAIKHYM